MKGDYRIKGTIGLAGIILSVLSLVSSLVPGALFVIGLSLSLGVLFISSIIRCLASIILLGFSASISAAIVVTPNSPLPTQNVRIEVVNQYTSESSVISATIIQTGNNFVINQKVGISCFLPSAPILTSSFEVGMLKSGIYRVVAQIENIGTEFAIGLGCVGNSVTQDMSFIVIGSVAIPIGDAYWYCVLVSLLALVGALHLSKLNGRKA